MRPSVRDLQRHPQLVADYTGRARRGRGPASATTWWSCCSKTPLTKGERRLVSKGRDDRVIDYRREFQDAMREDAIASVEEPTGRKVAAFMSANHIDPDLAAELFVLEPAPETAPSDDAR